MPLFKSKKRLAEDYQNTGFISSGTYGRVYKAVQLKGEKRVVAIKKYVLHSLDELDAVDWSEMHTSSNAMKWRTAMVGFSIDRLLGSFPYGGITTYS